MSFRIPKPAYGLLAPAFRAPVHEGHPNYAFHTVAGRPVLMFFMMSASVDMVRAVDDALGSDPIFDDTSACYFGVSVDPTDQSEKRLNTRIPGRRYILDANAAVSTLFGAAAAEQKIYEPYLITLDHRLRVTAKFSPGDWKAALAEIRRLSAEMAIEVPAPVLVATRILEPALCQELIDYYARAGGEPSGFTVEVDGKTVIKEDPMHKLRSDCAIEDEALRNAISGSINMRLRPLIQQAFNFDASRIERFIVACYDSTSGGYFRPHRDNTTKGTAHRRFAVSINLNDDFEGGDLRFPEFGAKTYRPPVGGAVVFGCGLLHEATPVTRGRRFATLPFLYDDAASKIREANNAYLSPDIGEYKPA